GWPATWSWWTSTTSPRPRALSGRRGAEVARRRAERALGRVEVVLVHEDRVVVHQVADALGHPHHLERLLSLRPPRGRGPRLAKASVLGVPALRALGAGTPVHALPHGVRQRGEVQAHRARQRRVGRESAARVARVERI